VIPVGHCGISDRPTRLAHLLAQKPRQQARNAPIYYRSPKMAKGSGLHLLPGEDAFV
jgi:hypothetical protein